MGLDMGWYLSLRKRLLFNLMYFRKPPWDTGISPPELLEFIATHSPGRALDLGCGTGTNAITLAKNGWQVTGVDFAVRAIRQARQKARRAGVQVDFHIGDVTQLDGIPTPFDLILDIGCLHNLRASQKKAYIDNLDRFLAPGGTFLLYAFLRPSGDSQRGIDAGDIESLCSRLSLVHRKDGSERGRLPSTWLTFQKS
jgi:cyclopropane fatty-acyl-phospholipid synthase-like methyltransferase